MGLFGNMYDKRKAKIADSAAPFLGDGEVAGVAAICQTEKQATNVMLGKQPYEQFLATATDESLYLFAISPVKNQVFGDSVLSLPLAGLEARMDGRRAVVGEHRLAPLRVDAEMVELVTFVNERSGLAAPAGP
jgi:hypothetical protein